MIEMFIKSNYQLLFRIIVFLVAIAAIIWFIWRTSSKVKNKKRGTRILRDKRKEIIYEVIKNSEDFSEKKAAELLQVSVAEARRYFTELVKEEKIVIVEDFNQTPLYKIKEK